jgi:hypothetical protein
MTRVKRRPTSPAQILKRAASLSLSLFCHPQREGAAQIAIARTNETAPKHNIHRAQSELKMEIATAHSNLNQVKIIIKSLPHFILTVSTRLCSTPGFHLLTFLWGACEFLVHATQQLELVQSYMSRLLQNK